jgi:glucokinase
MKVDQTLIGIDFGGTNMRVGLINDDKIIETSTKKVNKTGSSDDIFNDLVKMIEAVIGKHTMGIGIGIPGIVDVEKGIAYDLVNIPQWKEIHLKSLLEKKFNIPVSVNNDANCFAAGEKYYGKARNAKSCIGLIIGTGMGAGVIVNNKLFEGHNCGAGEFGCISYLNQNYEYYCSGKYFTNMYNVTAYDAAQRALHGDREAIRMYNEFGVHVGEALKMIIYAYDPELIILGGSVSNSFDLFKTSMYETLNSLLFKNTLKNLKIEVSEMNNVAIYGAAALYYNSLTEAERKMFIFRQ